MVCRQLGYPDAVAALRSAHYGEGTIPIMLANVSCTGDESNITNCGHNETGVYNCKHSEEVAVECLGMLYHLHNCLFKCFILSVPKFCPPVRLVGGESENKGRVEIYYNNTWGTVCSDYYWKEIDSNTVCRQLGYTGTTRYYLSPFIGHESVPVWMDRVSCGTYDICLGKCPFNGFGKSRCQHTQDVFVNCTGIRDSEKMGINVAIT